MNGVPKLLWALAVLPTFAGTVLFFAWYLTRADGLLLVGGYGLVASAVFVVVSIGLIVAFVVRQVRRGLFNHRQKRQAAWIAGLIALSIVASILYPYAVVTIKLQVEVEVVNESGQLIDSAKLIWPSSQRELGPIEPNDSARLVLNPSGEGRIVVEITSSGVTKSAIVVGYVPSPNGARALIIFDRELNVHVTRTEDAPL